MLLRVGSKTDRALAEALAGVTLVLGICTRFAALGAAAVLGIDVYSLQVVKPIFDSAFWQVIE
jgi:hypothetical protein